MTHVGAIYSWYWGDIYIHSNSNEAVIEEEETTKPLEIQPNII
jgi:hypothetical protein